MSRILTILDDLAAARGKAKEEVLKLHSDDEVLKTVLVMALDPFRQYGIKKVPAPVQSSTEGFAHVSVDEPTDNVWLDTLIDLQEKRLTGTNAMLRVGVVLAGMCNGDREVFSRILKKDLRCGVRASTVNKVFPNLIPTFNCMLAHKYDPKRIKQWPVIVEPKLDGVRVLCFADTLKNTVRFFSRSGKEYTTFDHIGKQVLSLLSKQYDNFPLNIVLDGEVVTSTFNDTVSQVRKKNVQASDAVFNVFHVMPIQDFEKGQCDSTMMEVRNALDAWVEHESVSHVVPLRRYFVNSHEEIELIYSAIREDGGEGVIVKIPDAKYVCKRNYAWMKIKAEETEDLRVIGAFQGTGKYEGSLGGLVVDRKGVEVRVGGGFSDALRDEIWHQYQRDEALADPYDGKILGRIIEVQYHETTPDGSLRHPRFVRFRDDKDVGEA